MNERNANLDLIKCIACIAVVGLHAVGMTNYTIYYFCDFGVPLFFMVNGYLLLSRDKADYSYAFRKILHIIKVVFLWNLLIAIPVFLFRQKLVNPFALTFNSLLQKGYLWHFWFFGALILIYLLLPILHRLIKSDHKRHTIICFALMSVCLTMSILSMTNGYPLHMFVPQSLRLWTWLFYFLSGGLLSFLPLKRHRLSLPVHGSLVLLLAVLNDFAEKKIGLYLISSRLAEYFYDDMTSILFHILLFTFLMRIPLKEKAAHQISFFSNLTMGIFIVHPILLTALPALHTPSGTGSVLIFWMGLTLLSFLITYVISKIPVIRELVKL